MIVEVSILVICLFIVVFTGMAITSKFDSKLVYILSVIFTPCVLMLVRYVYKLILENFFDFPSASDVVGAGTAWFLGLSILFTILSFSPTHTTKSGKADKRYKDNPATAPQLGVFMIWVFVSTIVLVNLYDKIVSLF